ncbi:SH3 domain-containing protein [Lentibacter sp. XHP0401]|uniref:SH3 domain-containing protein n=1 Tax=Lentibacter sp. XHP0401 TaxID=2984334 RepID=UPI0021E7E016|nr:SH3 domain-containing protein [Lentibacter sp. XHP0401]MCV2894379.1 SH3 domain-containing protein [Lentibacter sp. XHP0401]
MSRFIIVTFGFLFFAFYELSGGSDYAPSDGSRQALAAERAIAKEQKRIALAQAKPEAVAPAPVMTKASDTLTGGDETVVLASAGGAALPELKPGVATLISPPVDLAKAGALTKVAVSEPAEATGDDIREVTGSRVNLRGGPGTDYNAVGSLTRGTEVRVISEENGWVKLQVQETGRIGYMADFLLTASN